MRAACHVKSSQVNPFSTAKMIPHKLQAVLVPNNLGAVLKRLSRLTSRLKGNASRFEPVLQLVDFFFVDRDELFVFHSVDSCHLQRRLWL